MERIACSGDHSNGPQSVCYPLGKLVGAPCVPPDESDDKPAGVVHAHHARVTPLVLEQRSQETNGGTGSEKKDECVTLVPGCGERFLGFALVEMDVFKDLYEMLGLVAAVCGCGDEPYHGLPRRSPKTTKTGVSAASRWSEPKPFKREVCRKVVSTSRSQLSRSFAAGITRSRVTRVMTTERRVRRAASLTISSK